MIPCVAWPLAGALHAGAVDASDSFDTGDGTLNVDGQIYREWKDGGLGKLSIADILVKSSNLGAIQVAQRLGTGRLAEFPGRLGIAVAEDAPAADLACGGHCGVSVTAHQLAYAYATLVNGGRDPQDGDTVWSARACRTTSCTRG